MRYSRYLWLYKNTSPLLSPLLNSTHLIPTNLHLSSSPQYLSEPQDENTSPLLLYSLTSFTQNQPNNTQELFTEPKKKTYNWTIQINNYFLSYYFIRITSPEIFHYQLFTKLTPEKSLNQRTPYLSSIHYL